MHKEMLNWPSNEQAKYIRGFADGEGSVTFGWSYKRKNGKKYRQRNRAVKLSNTDKEMLLTIQEMLKKLDIESHLYLDTPAGVRKSTIDSWSLTILGKENFLRFRDVVSFTEQRKLQVLHELIASYR